MFQCLHKSKSISKSTQIFNKTMFKHHPDAANNYMNYDQLQRKLDIERFLHRLRISNLPAYNRAMSRPPLDPEIVMSPTTKHQRQAKPFLTFHKADCLIQCDVDFLLSTSAVLNDWWRSCDASSACENSSSGQSASPTSFNYIIT